MYPFMKVYQNVTKILTLSILFMALVFVSCKDEDKEPETVDKNEIVGKWQFVSVTPETAGTTIPAIEQLPNLVPCVKDLVFTFEASNKVSPSGCDIAVQALAAFGYLTVGQDTKWKVENNTLVLTNGTNVQTLPLKQNGDKMTFTINTNTTGTGAAVNAVLEFKRIN
jgi:hypothetical protein